MESGASGGGKEVWSKDGVNALWSWSVMLLLLVVVDAPNCQIMLVGLE